mmetsp:Transcript_5036/g.20184  ORF Transcript_5036/g.20184 Transcript_5036/m.20184 type:complete len:333 (-) Transcript_5036:369-1367(-)
MGPHVHEPAVSREGHGERPGEPRAGGHLRAHPHVAAIVARLPGARGGTRHARPQTPGVVRHAGAQRRARAGQVGAARAHASAAGGGAEQSQGRVAGGSGRGRAARSRRGRRRADDERAAFFRRVPGPVARARVPRAHGHAPALDVVPVRHAEAARGAASPDVGAGARCVRRRRRHLRRAGGCAPPGSRAASHGEPARGDRGGEALRRAAPRGDRGEAGAGGAQGGGARGGEGEKRVEADRESLEEAARARRAIRRRQAHGTRAVGAYHAEAGGGGRQAGACGGGAEKGARDADPEEAADAGGENGKRGDDGAAEAVRSRVVAGEDRARHRAR